MRIKPCPRSIVIVCAALSPFILATEPVPPPYHQFVLHGTVVRASNGPKAYFIVTLAGKINGFPADSTGDLSMYYSNVPGDRPQGITDSSGDFYAQVSLVRKPDSLAIRVEAPDRPIYLGNYFKTPDAISEITETVDESEPGCSGCSRNPVAATRVMGYHYDLQPLQIILPY